ncbi:hypothetical protein [Stackebrandtia soli]|uniref:hypothetical protein n=1 Tax=Stackebrandtia soli TaxID=1892856 RepID=UPI0039EC5EE3
MSFYDEPSRFDDDPDRNVRIRGGVAACRAILADRASRRVPERQEPLTPQEETLRRCREIARADRANRERRRRDADRPRPLYDPLVEAARLIRSRRTTGDTP